MGFSRMAVAHLAMACGLAPLALASLAVAPVARADDRPSAEGEVAFVNAARNHVQYRFSARTEDDGRVEGEVVFHVDRSDGHVLDARGTTTCIEVDGNLARIGAKLERLTQDGQEVSEFVDMYFTVWDNGEGHEEGGAGTPDCTKGTTDCASNMFFGHPQQPPIPPRSVQHCTTGLDSALRNPFPIDHGEVEVRPGEVETHW